MTVYETMRFAFACQWGIQALKQGLPEDVIQTARLVLAGVEDERRPDQQIAMLESASEVTGFPIMGTSCVRSRVWGYATTWGPVGAVLGCALDF
jgi:hypothetical protein